jgi:hypothetical protein
VTGDDLRHITDTVRDMVHMRLDAGDHPDDVLMSAWEIFEHWCRVHIDGGYPERDRP